MKDRRDRTGRTEFEDLTSDEKSRFVRGVFSSVSPKYDLMNDAMSFGLHRFWKDALVDWLAPRANQRLLDLAGGTGDIAFRFLQRSPGSSAVVLDLTESMVSAGQKRADALEIEGELNWVVGDAMDMPFTEGSFDACTASFGIRNVAEISTALSEVRRVLRYGGRLLVLEFSRVSPSTLSWLYDRYSYNVIPNLGKAVADDKGSYEYLVESIRKFPDQQEFAAIIRNAGFDNVKFRNLSFGVAAMHSGWKL